MINRDELADFLDELPKRTYPHASLQPSPEEMKRLADTMRKQGGPKEGNAKSVWEALIGLAEDISEGKR